MKIFFAILLRTFPLLVGGLLYVLLRAESLMMFQWFNFLGFTKTIRSIRQCLKSSYIPDWVLYSLPDGLWVFSFVSLMFLVWKGEMSKRNWVLILSIPLLGIGSEIGQLLKLVNGTYSSIDLLFYAVGTISPIYFNSKLKYSYYE